MHYRIKMKKLIAGLLFLVIVSCNKQQANTAIDVAEQVAQDTACALAHAEGTDAEVILACNITPALWPLVRPSLQTHRKKLATIRDGGSVVTVVAPCTKP